MSLQTDESVFTLSFKYKTPENAQSITYFAFTYPFSYGELQQMLCNIDSRFQNLTIGSKDDIYYARECVCYSLEGRRVDLITITSYHNISAEREVRLKNLFPNDNIPRPFRFIGKKVCRLGYRSIQKSSVGIRYRNCSKCYEYLLPVKPVTYTHNNINHLLPL